MKSLIPLLFFLLTLPGIGRGQVMDTAAVRREVDSLITLSRTLINKQAFDEALVRVQAAEVLAQGNLGEVSAPFANCCYQHGRVLHYGGNYKEAETWYFKALHINEKILGSNHLTYALCLNNLAYLYLDLDNYDKAEEYFSRSFFIRKKLVTKEQPEYWNTLFQLGNTYRFHGKYRQAAAAYEEVLAIAPYVAKQHGIDSSSILYNLGITYSDLGWFDQAEPALLEALKIKKSKLERNHPEYLDCLNGVAGYYYEIGDFEKAEVASHEIKSIYEEFEDSRGTDYASILNNLALLYYKTGKLDISEQYILDAIDIYEKNGNKGNTVYAMLLNGYADHCLDVGNLTKAKNLILTSKQIREKVLGKDHPDYANSLTSLASLYFELDSINQALNLYMEAKGIYERTLGKANREYAFTLRQISRIYLYLKRDVEAEILLLESKSAVEKMLSQDHQDYLYNITELADLYTQMKRYQEAETLYHQSLTAWERILSKPHKAHARNLEKLSYLYLTMKNESLAEKYLTILSMVDQSLLLQSVKYMSDKELKLYLNKLEKNHHIFLSFSQDKGSSATYANSLNNTLFVKGFLLSSIASIRHLSTYNSESLQLFNLQKIYLRHLAAEYAKPIAERDSTRIAEWEEKSNAIEKELVRTVAGYGDLIRQVSWQEVQQKLRPGEAAVELVSYRYYTPEPTDSTLYAALVLLPTDTAPHFITLFEERQLQALFTRPGLHEQLTVKGLYGSGSELFNLLWKPLESLLRDAKTIYYSPAGLLHRINPAALRDANKRPLSEGRQWVRVGSTRELVTGRLADDSFAHDTARSPTAAVWGGIRYDMDSTAFAAVNPFDPAAEPLAEFQRKDGKFRYMVEDSSTATLANRNAQRGSDDDSWEPLPGCEQEAQQVSELLRKAGFRTEVLTDYSASEERFKAICQNALSPRILHVATHGFAYPDPKKEPAKTLSGAEPTYKLQDDPMLRSGLLLAGANYYWKNKHPLQNREDGVLVAYEVRDLNLRNTELAVLSACQTGLGDVVGSEGVYGLQRAFRIAGAKFLIVSLWQVPDEQTQELMRLFYENWVDKRESLRDAFNHAQTTLREREPNPYMWAGFVLVE